MRPSRRSCACISRKSWSAAFSVGVFDAKPRPKDPSFHAKAGRPPACRPRLAFVEQGRRGCSAFAEHDVAELARFKPKTSFARITTGSLSSAPDPNALTRRVAMRILFISSNRIGDAVITCGVLDHLIRTHPEARFTIACGPAARDVFARMPNHERTIIVVKHRRDLHWLRLWRDAA